MSEDKAKELRDKITAGLKAGVALALEEHRRAGRKVAIWKDGRVQLVLPDPPVQESCAVLNDKLGHT
jgi:hypothetical protein